LHWIRNDGDLNPDDVLLLDAGVEVDSLYTADITRTLPLSGRFSDSQREIYLAVLEAQQAGIEAARPGAASRALGPRSPAATARRAAAAARAARGRSADF
jgi:Xaa-Pro aminopeptidase